MAKYSKEQKQDWFKKMRETAKKVRDLSEEERQKIATQCGTITVEGHPLSFFNCVFLWQQVGRALLQVGGFKQWKKAGRIVKKGERASGYIYVPRNKKNGNSEDLTNSEDPSQEQKSGRVRFLLVPVFDITQTQEIGEENEEPEVIREVS